MARLTFVVFCILLQSSFPQGNYNFFQQTDHKPLVVAMGNPNSNYNYGMLYSVEAEILMIEGLSKKLITAK